MSVPLQIAAPVRTGPDVYSGWQHYPAKLEGHNIFEASAQSQSNQLSNLKNKLFSNDVNLNIIDINEFQGAL